MCARACPIACVHTRSMYACACERVRTRSSYACACVRAPCTRARVRIRAHPGPRACVHARACIYNLVRCNKQEALMRAVRPNNPNMPIGRDIYIACIFNSQLLKEHQLKAAGNFFQNFWYALGRFVTVRGEDEHFTSSHVYEI